MTISQVIKKKRIRKKKRVFVPALRGSPYKKAVVLKLFIEKPKKPNSAKRKVLQAKIKETEKIIRCHIPGEGYNLNKHSLILVRGGRAQDLIGFRYKPVRGKLDLEGVKSRVTRKTKFGIK